MVADDVLLGAEDQRHGLVDDTVAQHQDGLLLAALGACGAVLEVDSSAEYLLRVVLERAGSVYLTGRLLTPVVDGQIHVYGLPLLPQIADAGREARASAVELKAAIAVHVAAAEQDLNQFDLGNLRWSKVIICTDGDVDGFQIRTLILTMLYRLCPTLIREGYVYIAETPLFEITCKEKTWFAYSEKEKSDILKSLEGKKVKVDRSKGLGENDPEMMWLTTMNPETRRLVQVMPDDAEETARVFDLLLGDNLAGRKDYIAENGYKYLDMIDVS